MTRAPIVLIVGTFDGVHRGHQALLRRAHERARALGGRVLAVAFERPPRFFFRPEQPPFLITSPQEREELLRRYGADEVVFLPFDKTWAKMTAREFLTNAVLRRWKAKEWVIGPGFSFGRSREGDATFLRKHAAPLGLRVHRVPPVRFKGKPACSESIRRLLRTNRLKTAAQGLGHPLLLIGSVRRGKGLGRRLGYPTANLDIAADHLLPRGVFAVRVTLPSGTLRGGILNIGQRPTVHHNGELSVEVHVLDFIGRLYGQTLRLDILHRLRSEKKFASRTALTDQIHRDERTARRLLRTAY